MSLRTLKRTLTLGSFNSDDDPGHSARHEMSTIKALQAKRVTDTKIEKAAARWMRLTPHAPILKYSSATPLATLFTYKGTVLPLTLHRIDL